ncbi:MAG TPA: hypothetical protein VMN39_06250, partial [Longimicrobiaceae bacterium]|nr:hypothetical protein [Longimicrobiaceae bacterium]
MNTTIMPLPQRTSARPGQAPESVHIDQLLQEYQVWSAEALDVLVALYEAMDAGSHVPAEAERFAS